MRKNLFFIFFAVYLSAGCTENQIIYSDTANDVPLSDIEGDVSEDAGSMNDVSPKSCKYKDDCNTRQDCVDFQCVSADRCRCENIGDDFCGCAYNNGEVCKPYYICYKQRWVRICETDLDCSEDAQCNNGLCEPYNFKIEAKEPYYNGGRRENLKAGYAMVYEDVPVGVSMAGYGARKGPKTPYNKELGGTTGFWDRPTIKALVLDNGVERIVYIRNGIGWSQDYLISGIAKELERRVGENYINKILMSSSHSHSYPARFWRLLPEMGLGVLGHDKFSKEIWERIAISHADAVELALKNMVPVRMGYITDDNFDQDDYITRNRRKDSMPFKDKRSAIIKFEFDGGENDGKIFAVVIRYGSHGTHMSDTRMSGDAPVAAEMISEENLSLKYGYHIPVIFMNGDGGNVAPAGNKNPDGQIVNRKDIHQIQAIGHFVSKYLEERLDSIKTTNDVNLEIVTKRIPFSRKHIGYTDNEFYKIENKNRVPYYLGAFQCCGTYKEEGYKDGELGCLLETTFLNYNRPVYQFTKTRLAAVNLNGLYLVSVNGESSAQYGEYVISELKKAGMKDVMTVGYSMDHHLYILLRDEWLLGGYESSMSVWGYKNGEYIANESIGLAKQLLTEEKEDNFNNIKPEWWEEDEEPVTPVAASSPPNFFVNPENNIKRGTIVLAKWHGGHPGVDNPIIYLQKKNGDKFEDVTFAGGIKYTDYYFHMIVEYLGNYKDNSDWQLKWEEKVSFDSGTYRFRVVGRYVDDDKKVKSYEIFSREFNYLPIDNMLIKVDKVNNGLIKLVISYPPPSEDSSRLHSLYVGYNQPYPVFGKNVKIRYYYNSSFVEEISTSVSKGIVEIPYKSAGNYKFVVEDDYGNTGELTTSL